MQCGSQNPEDASFCHHCGNRIYAANNAEATTDAPTYMPVRDMQPPLPFNTPPPVPTVFADQALWTPPPQSTPPPYPYFPQEMYNTPPPPPPEALVQPQPLSPLRQYTSRRGVVIGLAGLVALVGSGVVGAFAFSRLQTRLYQSTPTPITAASPQPTVSSRPSATPNPAPTPTPAPQPTPTQAPSGSTLGSTFAVFRGNPSEAYTAAWSPDGRRVASGGLGQYVWIWDPNTGQQLLAYNGQTENVYSVSWSPDSTRVASAADDGTVRIWQAA